MWPDLEAEQAATAAQLHAQLQSQLLAHMLHVRALIATAPLIISWLPPLRGHLLHCAPPGLLPTMLQSKNCLVDSILAGASLRYQFYDVLWVSLACS